MTRTNDPQDEDDYLEELSTDTSNLTPSSARAIITNNHSNSCSSGLGSLNSDSPSGNWNSDRTSSDQLPSAVFVDTNTEPELPSPKGSVWRISTGVLLMFLSCVTFVYTPYEMLMNERLKMVPGFPAYDWWADPPDEVLLKVYIFNVTNSQEFLNGEEDILRMEEVGPFVYIEKLKHTDVVFNNNGTLTYTAHRHPIFVPHLSNISMNATLIVPNLAVLGGASYMNDGSFITKMGFNLMVNRMNSEVFTTITPYNYMWNWTDPLIGVAKKFVPSMVPVENMGILHLVYSDFVDQVTVFMGTKHPRKFFLIDQFRGSDRLGYWEGKKCDSIQGSTEGVTYPQFLTRNDTIHYLRKTICRVATLYYARDVEQQGMNAYRWELPLDTYHRPPPGEEDCFTRRGQKPLPSGISDVSPCYFKYPIATSLPHLMGAATDIEPRLAGMQPDIKKHGSYVIIEPLTGIPMESRARSQSNLVVKQLSGYSKEITKFSNMILPMFWLEYGQQSLPWYVSYLMYFTIYVLPATQHWFSLCLLLGGFALFLSGISSHIIYIYTKFVFKYHKFERLSLGAFR